MIFNTCKIRPIIRTRTKIFESPAIAIKPKNESSHRNTITDAICLKGEGKTPITHSIAKKTRILSNEIGFPSRSNK